MKHLEVVIYDEINDYQEKIKGLTFRQWLFVVVGLALVIPTYIFLPKYTPINKDIASYIVMIEAAIVGFFGFIKIQGLDAEKIVPYWYRHYICFGKPLKYITDAEWKEQHQSKKEKRAKQKNILNEQPKAKAKQTEDTSSLKKSKKEIRKEQKQQQMLEKAKAKYGFMLEEDNNTNPLVQEPTNVNETVSKEHNDAEFQANKNRNPVAINDENSVTNDVDVNKTTADELLKSLSPEEKSMLIAKLTE